MAWKNLEDDVAELFSELGAGLQGWQFMYRREGRIPNSRVSDMNQENIKWLYGLPELPSWTACRRRSPWRLKESA